MDNFNLDTYCGLYCGACDVLLAYKTGNQEKMASHLNVEASQIKCHGCKSDIVFINCQKCKIRNCAINRNFEHCIDCNDYPCNLFSENKLPHWQITSKNLMSIKNVGVKRWLSDQEKQWKCPECQNNYSWYLPNCINCGKDLEKLKDYNNI